MNSSVELVTKVEDIPPPIFKVGDLVYFDTLKYTDPDEASLVENCLSEAALQITKLEEINSDLIKATLVLPPNTRGSITRNRNATYDCYTKYLSFVPGHGG